MHALEQTRVSKAETWLAAGVMASFTLTFAFGGMALEYYPRIFFSLMVISLYVFGGLSYLLWEELKVRWRREGEPLWVVLAHIGIELCIACLTWWNKPPPDHELSPATKDLYDRARLLATACLFVAFGLPWITYRWGFWLGVLALITIASKYAAVTHRFNKAGH